MSTLQASLESLLQTVAAVYDHDDLAAALSKYLPCALDSLSQKDSHTLTKAIKQTEKEFRATKKLLSMVDHDGMRRQLEDILAGMKDPQEWSAWTKKETCCLQKISDWIPVLWQLGVEKGRHRELVRKCLLLCEDVVARMVPHHGNTGERLPSQALKFCVVRSGSLAYDTPDNCLPRDAPASMWLEFLIVSVIQHSDAEATFIKDTIASFSPATSHTVGKLFQDELYPKKQVDHHPSSASALLDSLPDDSEVDARRKFGVTRRSYHQAVVLVRDCLYAPIIQTFRQSPTIETFANIVRTTHCITPTLLEVARQKVRGNVRSRAQRIGWQSAAMIFCECGTMSDLGHLSEILAATPMDDNVLSALLAIATRSRATDPRIMPFQTTTFKAILQRTISSS